MNRSIDESSKLLRFTFHRFMGKSLLAHAFFWIFPSFFLLFLTIAAAVFKPLPLTFFFAVLLPLGSFACIRYKTVGLLFSYACLTFLFLFFFKEIHLEDRLWHMTVFFVGALDLFIVLLSCEEVETIFSAWNSDSLSSKEECAKLHISVMEKQKAWEKIKEEFELEIQRFKEEAKQRQIEKQHEMRQFELIQSEIEMLTSQKEQLIDDTFKARSLAFESVHLAEGLKKEKENLSEHIVGLNHHLESVQFERTILQEKVELLQNDIVDSQLKNQFLNEEIKTLTFNLQNETDLKYAQHKQLEDLKLQFQSLSSQHKEEKEDLYKQVVEKSEFLSRAEMNLMFLQEKILSLQEVAMKGELKENVDLKRQFLHIEGLQKQLRSQFEEKSHSLFEARKELFRMHTNLEVLHKESDEESNNFQEMTKPFENDLSALVLKIEELEEEILNLEELVSHVLHL